MKHPTADNVWLVFIQLLNSWSSLKFVAGVGLNVLLCNPSWGLLCVCRFYLTNCWVKSSTSHLLSSVSSLSTWSGVSERPSCSTNQRWQPARSRAATNGVHNEKRAVFGSSDRTASCQPADGNRETEGPHTNKPFGLRLDSAALKQIWGAPAERKETWRTCRVTQVHEPLRDEEGYYSDPLPNWKHRSGPHWGPDSSVSLDDIMQRGEASGGPTGGLYEQEVTLRTSEPQSRDQDPV